MAMDNSSLIDLNCTIEEARTSVPLVPLPKINSPYEGEVSNDENNPFDWAIEAVSNVDDPFEFVYRKAQELGRRQSGQCKSKEGLKDKSEVSTGERKNIIENRNENADNKEVQDSYGVQYKSGTEYRNEMTPCQIKQEILNLNAPDVVKSANYIICSQHCGLKDSPEAMKPAYCSTPLHYAASAKRKLEDEFSPNLNKRKSNDFSPASIVKARVERCIAEVEKNFKKHAQERGKPKGRHSLDSLTYRLNSNNQRDTAFQCDQSLNEKYPLNYSYSGDLNYEFNYSFRNLHKSPNIRNFSEETFTKPQKEALQSCQKSVKPEDYFSHEHEARFVSALFKATSAYRGHSLANESVVEFVDLDSDGGDECEGKEDMKEMKENTKSEFQPTNPGVLEDEEDCVEVKMPKRVYKTPETEQMNQPNNQKHPGIDKSSKSVMSKMLGKMQSFSPRRSTSSLKERFLVESPATGNEKQQLPKPVQSTVSRSRSDSTVHALRKKEQMTKSSKWSLKEPSRFSNAVNSPYTKQMQAMNSPQIKQLQAVNSGRVCKPPKPLPKMFRNKKNLFTGKENIP